MVYYFHATAVFKLRRLPFITQNIGIIFPFFSFLLLSLFDISLRTKYLLDTFGYLQRLSCIFTLSFTYSLFHSFVVGALFFWSLNRVFDVLHSNPVIVTS